MSGKQLDDTHCGPMILPLLPYATEHLTARTGTSKAATGMATISQTYAN